eukprot:2545196-Pleurochrysis_carterae.AAC.3
MYEPSPSRGCGRQCRTACRRRSWQICCWSSQVGAGRCGIASEAVVARAGEQIVDPGIPSEEGGRRSCARARASSTSRRTARWCALRVSRKLSSASFLMRRSAKRASASLSAALAATALRLARRLAILSL